MSSDEGAAALKSAGEEDSEPWTGDDNEPWAIDDADPDDVVFNAAAPEHARPLPAMHADESSFEARGLREEVYLGKGVALHASNSYRAAQTVRKQGVARLDGVLSQETAQALLLLHFS